jgi:uncharacterized Zn finger protein
MSSFSYYPHYERPLPAQGGIQARSRRGPIGETWWSQRFIELLESFGVGSRLKRGRTYARAGQVVELEVEPGLVLAKVQGSRYSPYRVRIRGKVLSEHQWRRVEKAMAAQALPLAKLLAGEMPHDIEELFASCKLTLFPRSKRELTASCSCPDWANPCKHVAAAYYILAERFDEDPFLIFQARGRSREQIVAALRARRTNAAQTSEIVIATPVEAAPELADQLATFYQAGPELETITPQIARPQIDAALLKRLGPAPAETDADLRRLYERMSARALERILDE